jgi:fatty acid/phospholipid biosynthesis enzyme
VVIITHGRARRRMIRYAVGAGALAARAGIPARIARAFAAEAKAVPLVGAVPEAAAGA